MGEPEVLETMRCLDVEEPEVLEVMIAGRGCMGAPEPRSYSRDRQGT